VALQAPLSDLTEPQTVPKPVFRWVVLWWEGIVSDIAIFVLKRDVKFQLTNCWWEARKYSRVNHRLV